MSVSASVVSVRYCGAMQGKVLISALENKDCCCSDGSHMDMGSDLSKTAIHFSQLSDTDAIQQNQAYATAPKSCCTEIVLQSRLTANQLISSETNTVSDHAPRLFPAVIFDYSAFRPDSPELHQPMAIAFKAPPPDIPLYKLFQRFTYYG